MRQESRGFLSTMKAFPATEVSTQEPNCHLCFNWSLFCEGWERDKKEKTGEEGERDWEEREGWREGGTEGKGGREGEYSTKGLEME